MSFRLHQLGEILLGLLEEERLFVIDLFPNKFETDPVITKEIIRRVHLDGDVEDLEFDQKGKLTMAISRFG
ncbi:MAG: hypothetical protein H6624_13645 [Bdellovibrionaceae bacterium]|nr:hypothetical protein [Bdellovibrionales bacterium]MCB9085384.1 hypothetical protein [Pseudobdellovibrionaceae bacterium]